jgi:hypothetical protein
VWLKSASRWYHKKENSAMKGKMKERKKEIMKEGKKAHEF